MVAGSVHTALQQVVRVDRGQPFRPSSADVKRLAAVLERSQRDADVFLLSDYGYDSVTPALARPCGATLARASRRPWRSTRATASPRYRGVTLATPNESEASAAAGLEVGSDADLAQRGAAAAAAAGGRASGDHPRTRRAHDVERRRKVAASAAWGGEEAVDVTGAGDAVVAVAAAALASGAPPLEAAALANVAGAVAVSRRGAIAVERSDLKRALQLRGETRARRAAVGQ